MYDRRVVLKTCGRTTPLRALPDLLALGRERAAKGAASAAHRSDCTIPVTAA